MVLILYHILVVNVYMFLEFKLSIYEKIQNGSILIRLL